MKKILVVEDDNDLQKLMTLKLKLEGFEVLSALTGQDALDLAKQKPDLILLDILLPDIDGITVLSELIKDEELSKIPIIILSNMADQGSMEQTQALGEFDYLVKSKVQLAEVVKKIQEKLK